MIEVRWLLATNLEKCPFELSYPCPDYVGLCDLAVQQHQSKDLSDGAIFHCIITSYSGVASVL